VTLQGDIECDEAYLVAGYKGQPGLVRQAGRPPRRRRLHGPPGRSTLAQERPPIFGAVQRRGPILLEMLPDLQQFTLRPLFAETVQPGSRIYTDEYNIYGHLVPWGYRHHRVNHSQGEYARDDDGDGIREVHVNTTEGLWSLLRSWLRPHRGVSQTYLPKYLGFFECIHNLRRRGKALLGALLAILLAP
jgi:transposase-like protein